MSNAGRPFQNSAAEAFLTLFSAFVVPYSLALGLAALWVRFAELPSLFRLPKTNLALQIWLFAGFLFGLSVVLMCRSIEDKDWFQGMAQHLQNALRQAFGVKIGKFEAFVVAFFSSLGEEAFFRGALQSWLIYAATSYLGLGPTLAPLLAISLTAFIFGIVHAPIVEELKPWTAMAIAMGFAFGAMTWLSGSLLPAFVAHVTINYLNLRHVAKMRFD